MKLLCAEKPSSAASSAILPRPGGEARDRRLDAQHVEIGARREAGADLEQVVEPRARQAHLAGELVDVQVLVRMRAQQRDRAADARVLEARAAPQRRRGAPAGEIGLDDREQQLLQHELEALRGKEAVVQHFDRQRLGELADARRDGLALLREGLALHAVEHRREGLVQPFARDMEDQRALRPRVAMALAGIEEHELGVALAQHDGRIFLRAHLVVRASSVRTSRPNRPSNILTILPMRGEGYLSRQASGDALRR